jgi:LPXTG-motif cell wall-anchored protein
MTRSLRARATAVLGAVAIGVLGIVATATPAAAAGNIDPSQPRSFTVHLSQVDATSPLTPGTGQRNDTLQGAPISGVTFRATLVPNINLETASGWAAAAALNPSTDGSRATGTTYSATTDSTGAAAFGSTLPVGVYYVQVDRASLPATVTNPTLPFFVTLPFPTGVAGTPSNTWVYDVHVYPKNSETSITETRVVAPVDSAEARNPDLVRWNIGAGVPFLPTGQTLDAFEISKTLDTNLQYVANADVPTDIRPTNISVRDSGGADVSSRFQEGRDYAITFPTAPSRTLTAVFTGAGRDLLRAIPGGSVALSVLTRITNVPSDGVVGNTATAKVNNSEISTSATAQIGQLQVLAYAPTDGGTRAPLSGAEFQIYLTEADAIANRPITIDGRTSWTTDANGLLTVPLPTLATTTYYLKEITSPAGFQPISSALIPVNIQAGTAIVDGRNFVAVPHNQSMPAWMLPLTGGDGAIWFGIGGGALMLLTFGAALVIVRRRAALTRAAV